MSNKINIDDFKTSKEIQQQAIIWSQISDQFKENLDFYQNFISKFKDYKIILTGAGTSQFIGDALCPYFFKKGLNIVSIPTTDIVSNPKNYLNPNDKTLLISFARSGNSPESTATFDIANQFVNNIFNLVITCNQNGVLAKKAKETANSELFLLPKESNDEGFAMTSSYSGMTIAALLFLSQLVNQNCFDQIENAICRFDKILFKLNNSIKNLNLQVNDRVVYLGSGEFKGIAIESYLKLLELTQGIIPAFYNGILAFRHGPKSILNENTTIIFLMSKDEYSRKYEFDLISEISNDKKIKQLVILDNKHDVNLEKFTKFYLNLDTNDLNEIIIGIYYILFAQLLAVNTSVAVNINPDNPCPSGEVNRVVKGVKIYGDFN
ncbi:SIS domain-containing protein [Spiroplasma taiwanense]|uniref:Tagatose-6-phosphate ketose/aldose isomerase n=1 Tax=Spiroplasma taiwanense CT-1 TaxID=1276220 RepID=S5LUB6_9MOLU|nr:SIS domain-containing protein [Spiroplasma taiwanense]AGR41364.1 tagatose-6-phosphate ketose/aldose isomerase [Spiroplasma taiwanense CT-1]